MAASCRGCRCSWAAGVLCYFALRAEPPFWLGIAVALPAVGGVLLLRRCVVPRAAALALAAAAIGFSAAQFATARALPQRSLPTHAAILTGTVRSVEALPEGRRITLDSGVWWTARPLQALAAGAAEEGRRTGDRHRRHGPPAGAGTAPDAAGLSGCLGPTARCLVQRPRRVRLCARAGRARRRNAAERPAARWCSVCARSSRSASAAVVPGRGRRDFDHPADRHHHRHPAVRS